MRMIDAKTLIRELRASGTKGALRMANKLERRYSTSTKDGNIVRGATFNIKTQHLEIARYLAALDPLTEITRTTLSDDMLRIEHTYVPVETSEATTTAVKLLLQTRSLLFCYADILESQKDSEPDNETTRWELASVHAVLSAIEKL